MEKMSEHIIESQIPTSFLGKVSLKTDDKRYLSDRGRTTLITELQGCGRGRIPTMCHKDMTDAQLAMLMIEVQAAEMAEYMMGTILVREPMKDLVNMRGKY